MSALVVAVFGSLGTASRARAALDGHHPGTRATTHLLPFGPDAAERFVSRQVGSMTTRGAAAGAVVVGVVAAAVCAVGFGTSPVATATVTVALAATAGPFFGSLCGFALATHRWEAIREPLARLTPDDGACALTLARTTDPDAVGRFLVRHGGHLVVPRGQPDLPPVRTYAKERR